MAKLALAAMCLVVGVGVTSGATMNEFGIGQAVQSYNLVCWYEKLKQFPNTNSDEFLGKCAGGAAFQEKFAKKQAESKQPSTFSRGMKKYVMDKIPNEYNTCTDLLDKPDEKPSTDESDALNDAQGLSNPYPFQAFAYCLMQQLRTKFGKKAIEAVKDEKTHTLKDWRQTLLDRDNEFRARHGVEKFRMNKELNAQAQRWADKNAAECNMEHSDNDYADRQWNGGGTGESLASGGGDDNRQNAAYMASDGWYEEIKDYPYPEYTGTPKSLFKKIGHFTQTVWKGTKWVGYGYAYNKDCPGEKYYVAGRYSPAANLPGAYKDNVLPPKD